ncbi:MAG: hypothetical protein HQL13_06250 [Candidatus Omnitrophica bacterium]|nr:hypothetical protein [Candidatus Omnitrophota bacterium]
MIKRLLSLAIIFCFFVTSLYLPPLVRAEGLLGLPVPGTMVMESPSFTPALIRGLTVHKDNPFLFDFILDPGQSAFSPKELKIEADRMIKYFFAALTIPDKDIWVNLSPYEKERVLPQSLGVTVLGRDLLAQDYMLKQLTASLIYPQKELGKKFWQEVYAKARAKYGTTEIPVNTFNKVWIVPQKAGVYEHGQTAYIVKGHLKVMLEEDYLAAQKQLPLAPSLTKEGGFTRKFSFPPLFFKEGVRGSSEINNNHTIASNIIRAIILPEIEKEVNEGKNFSTLRQIFYAQVLAVWFKRSLKEALLTRTYANKGTVKGIDQNKAATNKAIYDLYLKAYQKGVFNFIRDDIDGVTQKVLPRKYFSGGYAAAGEGVELEKESRTAAMATTSPGPLVVVSTMAACPAMSVGKFAAVSLLLLSLSFGAGYWLGNELVGDLKDAAHIKIQMRPTFEFPLVKPSSSVKPMSTPSVKPIPSIKPSVTPSAKPKPSSTPTAEPSVVPTPSP